MTKAKRGRGRPKVAIDEEQVRKMATVGCLPGTIADFFGVDEQTIWNRFGDLIRHTKANRIYTILAKQWEKAVKDKDGRMLVWLGKNDCGQKEPLSITTEHPIELTVTYE